MNNFVKVLKEVIPGVAAEDLHLPLCETGMHSLDAIIVRDSLEQHFGFEIPDADWFGFKTLAETLEYCYQAKRASEFFSFGSPVNSRRSYEITIPLMANAALSENWLLKEMGDMHWALLSDGLQQKSSRFTDSLGNRLYAAFVRIKYAISPLNQFAENETLHLANEISRYGNSAYYSGVNGHCIGKKIEANLMTSFSVRKNQDNSQITSSNPEEKVNHVPELDAVPDFHSTHRLVKKGLIKNLVSGGYTFRITDSEIDSLEYTINPYYEVNGVGLLYFAAYPIIADRCASTFFKQTMELADYDRTYHTIFRDCFFFANCNADDKIIIKLNYVEILEGDRLQIATSLYRQSDGKLMARIFTVKQK